MEKKRIFGVVYGNKTTPFIPYLTHNSSKPWRFENNAIIDVINSYTIDLHAICFVGVLSWKFQIKTGLNFDYVNEKCDLLYDTDCQLINFSPNLGKNIGGCGNFMDWSDAGHKGIKQMVIKCCNHVGLTYNNDPKVVVYANLFVARLDVYRQYVNNVLIPCLELLEGEMWDRVNVNAGYTAGLEPDELLKHTGLKFYNYIPFILERMMMQYIDNLEIKTISIR